MFKLNQKYEDNKNILKCDYIRYSPSEISTMNTANSQIYINIPGADAVISLLNSYLDLNFDVLHAANKDKFADGKDINLVNLGPIALFSNYKLTIKSANYLEEFSHAQIVSLMYNLITSARDSGDFPIAFDRDRGRIQRKLTKYKNIKGKYHVKNMLEDLFSFSEHQEKAFYGFGKRLVLTGNTDKSNLNKANATNIGKSKINSIEWYVPQYIGSISQLAILSKHILRKTPTELQYLERSAFMKEVHSEKLWTFE